MLLLKSGQHQNERRNELIETTFRIPVAGNDGQPFEVETWEWLHDQLIANFGGYTVEGPSPGNWLSEAGHLYREPGLTYRVAIAPSAVETLREVCREAKTRFDQEAIYLAINWGVRVEFI